MYLLLDVYELSGGGLQKRLLILFLPKREQCQVPLSCRQVQLGDFRLPLHNTVNLRKRQRSLPAPPVPFSGIA